MLMTVVMVVMVSEPMPSLAASDFFRKVSLRLTACRNMFARSRVWVLSVFTKS